MNAIIYALIFINFLFVSIQGTIIYNSLNCTGKVFHNVSLSAYFPQFPDNSEEFSEENYLDARGKKLFTLQDFLDDRADFVTVSLDPDLKIPYRTKVCIPELNYHFNRQIMCQIRDNSSSLRGNQYSKAFLCVRSPVDSYDSAVNRFVTLVF